MEIGPPALDRLPLWLYAVVVLVVGAVSYSAGRYTQPDKETETHIVAQASVLKEDTQAREQVKTLTAQLEELKSHTHTVKTVVVRPDGTREARTETDKTVEKQEQASTTVASQVDLHTTVQAQASTQTTDTRVTERSRPDWRVGPMVGLDLHTGQVGYGALVERRILGPLSMGIWGLSSGQGGAVVTLEF